MNRQDISHNISSARRLATAASAARNAGNVAAAAAAVSAAARLRHMLRRQMGRQRILLSDWTSVRIA